METDTYTKEGDHHLKEYQLIHQRNFDVNKAWM